MKMMRIWKTDGGVIINGTDYHFDDWDSVAFTFGRVKHIMRGANGRNNYGIDTEEGVKTPDTAQATIVDMSQEIYDLLNKCFREDTRIDLYFIDRQNLGKVQFNNARITAPVRQLNIGAEDTNLQVILSVESFDVDYGDETSSNAETTTEGE